MTTIVAGPKGPPVGTIIMLAVASVLYIGMLASMSDSIHSDAAGRGIGLAFASFLGVGLWLVLACLLIVAAINGSMPRWAMFAAVILVPLSAVAAEMAIDAYGERDASAIWIPALLAPMIALYAVWARLPALQTIFRAGVTSAVLGGLILLLSLTPIVQSIRAAIPDPERDARLEEQGRIQQQQRDQEQRDAMARDEATFRALGPDSSLGDYLPYLGGSRFAEEALIGVQKVKSRQADAVALLQKKPLGDLHDLWQFNLVPSTELCRAYADSLAAMASRIGKTQPNPIGTAIDIEFQLRNIRWLLRGKCDLKETLGRLAVNIRAVADSSRLTGLADTLDDLASGAVK